jgi:hypothetical protein
MNFSELATREYISQVKYSNDRAWLIDERSKMIKYRDELKMQLIEFDFKVKRGIRVKYNARKEAESNLKLIGKLECDINKRLSEIKIIQSVEKQNQPRETISWFKKFKIIGSMLLSPLSHLAHSLYERGKFTEKEKESLKSMENYTKLCFTFFVIFVVLFLITDYTYSRNNLYLYIKLQTNVTLICLLIDVVGNTVIGLLKENAYQLKMKLKGEK